MRSVGFASMDGSACLETLEANEGRRGSESPTTEGMYEE
jgi:hypothetical protein